jgi:apolipoprotein N-acyltransferase
MSRFQLRLLWPSFDSFVQKDGSERSVLYPTGLFVKGRILPDQETEKAIRSFYRRSAIISLSGCIAVMAVIYWLFLSHTKERDILGWILLLFSLLVLAPAFFVWHQLRIRVLIAGCPIADGRLNERNRKRQWSGLFLCVLLFAGGLWELAYTFSSNIFLGWIPGAVASLYSGALGVACVLRIRADRASRLASPNRR